MNSNYDIKAEITFLSTKKGGRKTKTPDTFFSCSMVINGTHYDCRLLLNENGGIMPGETVTVPIKFLNIETVSKVLKPKLFFDLWDGRIVASGSIRSIRKTSTTPSV